MCEDDMLYHICIPWVYILLTGFCFDWTDMCEWWNVVHFKFDGVWVRDAAELTLSDIDTKVESVTEFY